NKILAPFAKKITVSFEKSLNDFPREKTVLTGNPVREIIFKGNKERLVKKLNLESNLPVLLVLGGGTGAQKINELIWQILPELTKFCQVIHLTGRGKLEIRNCPPRLDDPLRPRENEASESRPGKLEIKRRYHSYEFLTTEIADAYAVADLVITRAGMNVLTELAVLGKPTIIIPIPDSHQEANARYFQDKNAAVVLNQKELTNEKFINEIKELINDQGKKNQLSENIKKIVPNNATEKMVKEILIFSKFSNY
ncbi:MAG: UDP-N-acetylglucosamine--N-acetylmuramyl-(pentapeptide) pyrophosphoryl-undecaprenol N-acetylglucosamine transferase, partial [Patescibacteria group bacterium]